MKNRFLLVLIGCVFLNCSREKETPSFSLELFFTHSWGNTTFGENDFRNIRFENAAGEALSINRLRYLLSNIQLVLSDGSTIPLKGYQLIDLSKKESLQMELQTWVAKESIREIAFVFGFEASSNREGIYPDLNVANWNVPASLGGGYHFMQLDGTFMNLQEEVEPFNIHAIRAVQNAHTAEMGFKDTSFEMRFPISVRADSIQLQINMDVAEWFVNPHRWELNEKATGIMADYEAQLQLAANGKFVFSQRVIP